MYQYLVVVRHFKENVAHMTRCRVPSQEKVTTKNAEAKLVEFEKWLEKNKGFKHPFIMSHSLIED